MIKDNKSIIEIEKLNKTISKKHILKDITLSISKGERVAFVGGNGAGKTTLIETMLGIMPKSSGTITYDFEYKKSPLEKVGVQFQDSNFPEGLTGWQIIDFFSSKSQYTDKELINKLTGILKMESFLNVDASKLSGGQSQKLNVVLALANNPDIVVLDELTTGLDVFAKNAIVDEVEKFIMKKNATMLLVTHTPHEIERLATRVVVINKGEVVGDFSVEEVVKKYGTVGAFLDQLAR